MSGITFDEKTMTVSIDAESFSRLTEGTPFQQSTNALAMMNGFFEQNDLEMLNAAGIPKKSI
jgi:hypothetical protein